MKTPVFATRWLHTLSIPFTHTKNPGPSLAFENDKFTCAHTHTHTQIERLLYLLAIEIHISSERCSWASEGEHGQWNRNGDIDPYLKTICTPMVKWDSWLVSIRNNSYMHSKSESGQDMVLQDLNIDVLTLMLQFTIYLSCSKFLLVYNNNACLLLAITKAVNKHLLDME